jgi:hypothetical protein
VKTREAPVTHFATSSGGIAALLLLSAWCAPAIALNGVTILCDQADETLPAAEILAPAFKLSAQVDSYPRKALDNEEKVISTSPPAMAETVSKLLLEEPEDSSVSDDAIFRFSEFPGIAAHLPGVSETALPRFQHRMFRTDI